MNLGDRRLCIADVVAATDGPVQVALADTARDRIGAARAVVARHAAGQEPVYGLNTGLGGNLGHRLAADEIGPFQAQIIRGRMVAVGEPIDRRTARAALFCRIAELAGGHTGVSLAATEGLMALFNRGITPVLPRHGSLGASDMGLVAHMAGVLIGLGEAEFDGARMPADQALARAGLQPVALEAKDGLGLISHGAVTTATAALTLACLGDLLGEAVVAAGLGLEGYRGNPAILDPRLAALRPAAGQVEAAGLLRKVLAGSYLEAPGAPGKVQDALCFREMGPIHGTTLAALATAVAEVEIELNGTTCSPVVLTDSGEMLSSPNFHPSSLALALDALAIALTHQAWAQALRITKMMSAPLSGLPRYLSPVGGASAGYVTLQKTAGALHAEVRARAMPAMLEPLPVSDTVEDVAPMALLAARKLAAQLEPLRYLTAIEVLVGAQAVDLRGLADRLAPATARLHAAIRAQVPMLVEDRPPGADVEAVRRVLDATGRDREDCRPAGLQKFGSSR